jgi:hypothetical protein
MGAVDLTRFFLWPVGKKQGRDVQEGKTVFTPAPSAIDHHATLAASRGRFVLSADSSAVNTIFSRDPIS